MPSLPSRLAVIEMLITGLFLAADRFSATYMILRPTRSTGTKYRCPVLTQRFSSYMLHGTVPTIERIALGVPALRVYRVTTDPGRKSRA